MLPCVALIVMLTAKIMSCVCLGRAGMSDVYMLKSVRERLPVEGQFSIAVEQM